MGRLPSPQRLRPANGQVAAGSRRRARLAACLALAGSAVAFQASRTFQGPNVERALATARVVDAPRPLRDVATPIPATLSAGGVLFRATWLSVDSTRGGLHNMPLAVEETYRGECAAYRVDRLLRLGMVPASVQRVISGARGALAIDVDRTMTEAERDATGRLPPDKENWDRQVLAVRFFDNLIANADRRPETILITADWHIRLVGHTRAFRDTSELVAPDALTRFSRTLLEAAERLDEPTLRRRLDGYVSIWQIQALLERRDRLVALARSLAAKHGPDVVYYP